MIPIRQYEGEPMNAATTLLARINALRQQKQNLEFDRAQEERAAEAARVLEEERQLRMRQTEALMKDAELKRAKEAAALIKSTVPGEKTTVPGVQAAPVAAPMTPSDVAQFDEPNAAESAQEVKTVPRMDIPPMETQAPPTPRAPIEVNMGEGIGTVRVPFQDELEAEAKRKRRETEININDPDVQAAIKQLPEGLGSMIRIMADSEGFLPRTGLAGSLAALSKTPTEPRMENPEPVVIDGVDTLATPTEIAQAKAAGKSVRVYHAPSTTGQPDASGLSPKQSVNLNSVINKYQQDAVVKQADQGRTITAIADSVIANPQAATKQLAALYILVKNLDPTSAVREGELSLANATQSYLQTWENTLARLSHGQVIAPAAAVELAKATKEITQFWNAAAERKRKQYGAQAGVLGVGPQFEQYLSGFDSSYGGGEQEFVRGPDGKLVPKGK
jgi:hypothetical protein